MKAALALTSEGEQPDRSYISEHADEQRGLRADAPDNAGVNGSGQKEG
jgi:hypothetical protein